MAEQPALPFSWLMLPPLPPLTAFFSARLRWTEELGDVAAQEGGSLGSSCSSTASASDAGGYARPLPSIAAGKALGGGDVMIGRNLGPREGLSSLSDEWKFNKSFVDRVRRLEKRGYCGWRRVRGDGNCFYRAVGFGLLEQLVAAKPLRRLMYLTTLRDQLASITYQDDAAKAAAHADLIERVERLRCGDAWEAPCGADAEMTPLGLLYRNLQNPGETADLALVRALRRLTANYIRNHADEFTTSESGISYRDIAMATGFEDVEDFCGRIVLPDGEDAETLCQHALPAALGVVVRIVFLDRREGGPDSESLDFCAGPRREGEWVVHVQLRPGHYDLLYWHEAAEGASRRRRRRSARRPATPGRGRPPTLGHEGFAGEFEVLPFAPQSPVAQTARFEMADVCL